MSGIYKEGQWYGNGSGGDTSSVELTQAEYNALTEEEKNNGTVYYITDAEVVSDFTVLGNRFDKANIYTADERMVGAYMGKPLYQKTFEVTFTQKNMTVSIDSSAVVTSVKGGVFSSSNTDFIPIGYGSDPENVDAYQDGNGTLKFQNGYYTTRNNGIISVQYTKSSDGTINIGTGNDYSTDEQIIGTWIDGKPIYQKTYTGIIPNNVSIGWHSVDDDTTKIFINGYGYIKRSGGDILNIVYSNSSCIGYIQNKLSYGILNNEGTILFSNGEYNVTFQYTKTTD